MPPVEFTASAATFVEDLISKNRIIIFSKTTCPWCTKVKNLFQSINEDFNTIELDTLGKREKKKFNSIIKFN